VIGQIEACGCVVASNPDDCDFILGVVTPSRRRTDRRPEFLELDREERSPAYASFLQNLHQWMQRGKPVAIADVAYPNGSDPLMSEMLLNPSGPIQPGGLAGYGAWNTAGNTLGTVVAQASCSLRIQDRPEREAAQRRFLAHRFLEDYGYQQRVRAEARLFAKTNWDSNEPDQHSPEQQAAVGEFIELRLTEILRELQNVGIGVGLRIAPGSTSLPWRRTFEADFDLEAIQATNMPLA
jgi:hypothetical protein